jgi:hypothetical protein
MSVMSNIVKPRQRKQRQTRKCKLEVGTTIKTQTVTVVSTTGEEQLYWFEVPEGFSPEDDERLRSWIQGLYADGPGVRLYGPFKTHAEVRENERLTLLGPHDQVSEGGQWDPAWDKPQ